MREQGTQEVQMGMVSVLGLLPLACPFSSFASQLLRISEIKQDFINPPQITRTASLRLAISAAHADAPRCLLRLCVAGGCRSRFQTWDGSWYRGAAHRLIISLSHFQVHVTQRSFLVSAVIFSS